jgi:hypothetical protein
MFRSLKERSGEASHQLRRPARAGHSPTCPVATLECIKKLGDVFGAHLLYINAETFLLARWNMVGIKADKFPRMMFICAVRGDSTRGRPPGGSGKHGPHGLELKYDAEYHLSKGTCVGFHSGLL